MKNILTLVIHIIVSILIGILGLQIYSRRKLPPYLGIIMITTSILVATLHVYIFWNSRHLVSNEKLRVSHGVKILPGTENIGGVASFGGGLGGGQVSGPGTPGNLFS